MMLWWFTSKPRPRLAPTGLFLLLYGCARFAVEWVRLPDANIGYLVGDWLTMGMLLTMPMIFVGAGMMLYAYRRNAAERQSGRSDRPDAAVSRFPAPHPRSTARARTIAPAPAR